MTTEAIDAGQFDDAPEDTTDPAVITRNGNAYIDTHAPVIDADFDFPESSEDEDEEAHNDEDEDYEDDRVEDEDWENAERDFTKQYNRLRQHAAVRAGNAQGTSSAHTHASVASLPAVNVPKSAKINTAAAKPIVGKDSTSDQLAALAKYNSRLAKIDAPYVMGVGVNRKGPSAHANMKDKSDRATNEQVLDPRTRLILFKMIGRGVIDEVNGCVSTGKEANVYHALTPEGAHLALKIYKTSILVFKDRDKYVTGEFRFRKGYSRNPRKMVRMWAEKEMRNLKRLVAAGVRAPDPVEVRENVLVMTFVGDKDGWASPRLKDASLPPSDISALYKELVLAVRRIFHVCKLVHADLSEYNIMYHEGHLWIIDVSQSVEHDHPAAFDFLRNDIKNVEEFFGRLGVTCLGLRGCFEFVIKERLSEEEGISDEDVLQSILDERAASGAVDDEVGEEDNENQEGSSTKPSAKDQEHEDAIFMQSYIPRTLNEVYDPERDVEKHRRGDDLIYADTIGLVSPSDKKELSPAAAKSTKMVSKTQKSSDENEKVEQKLRFEDNETENWPEGERTPNEGEDEDEDESDDSDDEAGERSSFKERKPRGHRHEDKDEKKERKKQVKEAAKEKRKNKMPKSEKKRIIKKTRS